MRKALENFYYGNLEPCGRQVASDSRLKQVMDKAGKCEEKLMTKLEDDEKSLLLNLVNAQNEIGSTLAMENFILGFRLGMRLTMEGMDENDGCLVDLTG